MPRHQEQSVVRYAAIFCIAIGAVIMVVAIFADSIGISGGGRGFGWKQLIAAIVGLVVLLIGLAWLLRPLAHLPAEETEE
ncbi:MAG TPA: hypothetical protein VIL01_15095 [Thermomicrobiales bacterium]|jgi:Kef-type K+ transport system membrane component KefB